MKPDHPAPLPKRPAPAPKHPVPVVVLDTSVLIASFFLPLDRPCFSRDVFDFVTRVAQGVISEYIRTEFHEKCRDKLGMSGERIDQLMKLILSRVTLAPAPKSLVGPKRLRDHDDLPILALAAAVKADFLLTWDKDLLTLGKFRRTRILSPRSFWDHVR